MKIDKRPFYIWVVVLLANIGTVLGILLFFIYHPAWDLSELLNSWTYIILGISLFITIVPVLFSKSNGKWKNHFGYGIPVLLFLTLSYLVDDDWFGFMYIYLYGLSAIIFALFYTMGVYVRKWNVKFVLNLIWIEVIFLVGSAFSALYFSLLAFN